MRMKMKVKTKLSLLGKSNEGRVYNIEFQDILVAPKEDGYVTVTEIHGNFGAAYSSWQFDPTGCYLIQTSNWKRVDGTPKAVPKIGYVIPFTFENALTLEDFIEEYGLLDGVELDQYTFIVEE